MIKKEFISNALSIAARQNDKGDTESKKNRNRSKNFVEALRSVLEDNLKKPNRKAFSKHYNAHRLEFGLNELMYDILICETESFRAPKSKKEIYYVSKSILEVESELKKDLRHAIYDFNKLVIGSAELKLFIGPIVGNVDEFISPLAKVAEKCNGQIFLALITHPSEWNDRNEVLFYVLNKDKWKSLS